MPTDLRHHTPKLCTKTSVQINAKNLNLTTSKTSPQGCVCPSEWLYWPVLQNLSYAADAATAALISDANSRGIITAVLWTCYPKPPPTTTTTPAPTPATTPAPTPPPPRTPRPAAITWPRTDVQKFGDAVSKGFAGAIAGVVALGDENAIRPKP